MLQKRPYKTNALILLCFLILTSCSGVWCSVCSSFIENNSHTDIYAILVYEPRNFYPNAIDHFANDSQIKKYNIDTINKTGVFIIPSGGHLKTYSGPGDNPALPIRSLRIITDKKIIYFPTQEKIVNAFNKSGVLYSLVIN